MKRFKRNCLIALLVFTLSIITGCLKSEPSASSEPRVLRILGSEYTVNQDSSYFEVSHDNVSIELINIDKIYQEAYNNTSQGQQPSVNPDDKIKEIINGPNPPDVIYLNQTQLTQYIEEGLITPLDSFIEKEKFDLDGIAPALINGIRNIGNGTLYALAPTFESQVLIYNKTMFDKMNIPYPEDKMSWEQIFNLARQLTHEENGKKIYGLAFESYMDASSQMDIYTQPLNLSIFNADYTSVTVNTPEWEKVWSTIAELHTAEIVPPLFNPMKARESGEIVSVSYADRQPFLFGRAAMAIGRYNDIRQLAESMTGNVYYGDAMEQSAKFEWDIVTLPIHPEVGDVGGNVSMYDLLAINANSDQADLAWQYISFINGEKMAKVKAKQSWQLVSRFEHVQQPEGLTINLNAFVALTPANNTWVSEFRKLYPKHSPYEITSIGSQLLEQVINGEKTVQEALAEYQTKGQEALDRIRQEENQG